ncbi:MAG: EamA family transporter [Vicinamibacterales bacterium]
MTLAWAAWLTICVVWGTTYLAIRVSLETVPVLLVAGLRWMAAGVLLSAIVLARGRRLPPPRQWGSLLLLGFLMNLVGNGFVVWAEQYVASGLAAVVIATVPFWSLGFEAVVPPRQPVTRRAVTGLLIGSFGVVVLVWPALVTGGGSGRNFVLGVLALQVACAGWALGTSYAKRHAPGDDPLGAVALQMTFSGIMLLVLASANGEWAALHFSVRSLAAMAYLTIVGSLVAYTAYIYAVRHLPVSTVSLYAYINPLIAVLLGAALLGEPLSARIAVASTMVLAGMAIVGWPRPRTAVAVADHAGGRGGSARLAAVASASSTSATSPMPRSS